MTQNKKLNFKIGLLAILTLLVFVIGCVLAYTTNANKVYADYEDLSSDAILNFNQLLGDTYNSSFNKSNGVYSGSGLTISSTYTVVSIGSLSLNHKYYFNFSNASGFNFLQITNNMNYSMTGQLNWVNGSYSNIFTCSNVSYNFYLTLNASNTSSSFIANLIDLTLMYGSGNEPSLAQCKEIFTAEYYSYTSGRTLTYSTFESYNTGYNDAVSSHSINYSTTVFLNSVYNINSSTYQVPYLFGEDYIAVFDGSIGFPLGISLQFGDSVSINFDLIEIWAHNIDFSIGYYVNSVYVELASISHTLFTDIEEAIYLANATVNFTCPTSLDTLVFRPSVIGSGVYLKNVQVSATTFNYTASIKSTYDSAYQAGYKAGKSYGESLGYERGLDDAENATFQSLFAAVIDAPVNVIASSLDFDLLGINLKTFFFSLFTVALVITIIRIFI